MTDEQVKQWHGMQLQALAERNAHMVAEAEVAVAAERQQLEKKLNACKGHRYKVGDYVAQCLESSKVVKDAIAGIIPCLSDQTNWKDIFVLGFK